MSTIKDQIELEKRMVSYGANRYQQSVKTALDNNRGSDTAFAQRLITSTVDVVANALDADVKQKSAGKNAKYRVLLRQADAHKAAYIGLKYLFDYFVIEKSLVSLGNAIGAAIEDELRFTKFQNEHGEYYDTIIRDFKNKGTVSYRHRHRVLLKKGKEKGVEWAPWSIDDKVGVGTKILEVILQTTDIAEKTTVTTVKKGKHKTEHIIRPTAETMDWIRRFDRYAELLVPDRVPCVVPPEPWSTLYEGGYYTPVLRRRTPMVKTRDAKQVALLEEADLTTVKDALNTLQEVPWSVNTEVLDVMQAVWGAGLAVGLPSSEPYIIPTCPVSMSKEDMTPAQQTMFEEWKAEARIVHSLERERVAKCLGVSRIIRMATEFKDYERFWYVYQCDFRGRVYSTVTGLSPQGPEYAKALLRFAEGKPLGDTGERWFKIHGANCYGHDKLPYAERVKWVDDNTDLLLAIAEDPVSNKSLWADTDKPWQFLAWVLEFRRFHTEGDKFISYVPVSLDGSCNGLQNFSAMLRDSVGGRATNLIPNDTPADIYATVSTVLSDALRKLPPCEFRDAWLSLAEKSGGNLKRSLAKRPVMTLPYGSTRHSCQDYIFQYILEEAQDHFKRNTRFRAAMWLTPHLWAAISEVVISAREVMDWLQRSAHQMAGENIPLIWTAPNGFPVVQGRKQRTTRQVETRLCGRVRLTLNVDMDKLDSRKQMQGVSPNFVHSMDASHLMFTVLAGKAEGLSAFAVIHDDFGTHAADTGKFQRIIRESFIRMYEEHDPVQEFIQAHATELPPPPTPGDLDIKQVSKSLYFFG